MIFSEKSNFIDIKFVLLLFHLLYFYLISGRTNCCGGGFLVLFHLKAFKFVIVKKKILVTGFMMISINSQITINKMCSIRIKQLFEV